MVKGGEKASELHAKLLDEMGVDAGPETLQRDLDAAREFYLKEGARWHAFTALKLVANQILQQSPDPAGDFDGVPPETPVSVPWWAVRAAYLAWMTWENGECGRADKISLGQAFGVERMGQGQRSSWEESEKNERQMRIATLVAEKIGCGSRPMPIDYALDFVAIDLDVEKSMVREAWREFGGRALEALRRAGR
ncbi:MAG: hypothetical protein IH626_17555 [Rhodospirillales bacterium]|nr:hypothetical protein [Rhodospirillales bacterium]